MVVPGQKLWEATLEAKRHSYMSRFAAYIGERFQLDTSNWERLYRWSVTESSCFWQGFAEFSGVRWQKPAEQILQKPVSGLMREHRWFVGAHLNFAENLLPSSTSSQEVVVAYQEGRQCRRFTGGQLYNDVAACALSMQKKGLQVGDRVAGVLLNSYEALVAMLATTALGAIWSSCSPDFGPEAIFERLGQIKPKFIFFTEAYYYHGSYYPCRDTIQACLRLLADKPIPIIVGDEDLAASSSGLGESFTSFLALSPASEHKGQIAFAYTPFDHPLYILFSSGTTGKPKAIVHGVGGTLLQHKKELMLHTNLGPGSKLCYFTTCGWMMWNWMASALAVGASLVTFDGSPFYPSGESLWKISGQEGVSALGVSPKFLSACMQKHLSPHSFTDLSRLKTVLSTGSPLLPEHYAWVYREVKEGVHLASISGGTDIISCFMLGNPLLPVRAGEIQGPGLGMDVQVWNQEGEKVVGTKGELVCCSPFVSMPLCFLNDADGSLYQQAYFDFYAGKDVWRHGDYCEESRHGGFIIYGRSDATLNPGGVRIGTSEIYRQLEKLEEIDDAIAVGHRLEGGDVEVVLFVKLKESGKWGDELANKIKTHIRKTLSPRHTPAHVLAVTRIPYTRSGKKVELAVAKALHGETVENLNALAEEKDLEEFYIWGKKLRGLY